MNLGFNSIIRVLKTNNLDFHVKNRTGFGIFLRVLEFFYGFCKIQIWIFQNPDFQGLKCGFLTKQLKKIQFKIQIMYFKIQIMYFKIQIMYFKIQIITFQNPQKTLKIQIWTLKSKFGFRDLKLPLLMNIVEEGGWHMCVATIPPMGLPTPRICNSGFIVT